MTIDWEQTPAASIAHIYWQRVDALQVLSPANRLCGTHLLPASDSHAIDRAAARAVT